MAPARLQGSRSRGEHDAEVLGEFALAGVFGWLFLLSYIGTGGLAPLLLAWMAARNTVVGWVMLVVVVGLSLSVPGMTAFCQKHLRGLSDYRILIPVLIVVGYITAIFVVEGIRDGAPWKALAYVGLFLGAFAPLPARLPPERWAIWCARGPVLILSFCLGVGALKGVLRPWLALIPLLFWASETRYREWRLLYSGGRE